ncbi:hypothetical protein [Micromonospora sp. NPDC050200]
MTKPSGTNRGGDSRRSRDGLQVDEHPYLAHALRAAQIPLCSVVG